MIEMKQNVQIEKFPSLVANSGATSHHGKVSNPFLHKGKLSTKIFHTMLGQTARESKAAKLIHNVHELACTVHLVPGL